MIDTGHNRSDSCWLLKAFRDKCPAKGVELAKELEPWQEFLQIWWCHISALIHHQLFLTVFLVHIKDWGVLLEQERPNRRLYQFEEWRDVKKLGIVGSQLPLSLHRQELLNKILSLDQSPWESLENDSCRPNFYLLWCVLEIGQVRNLYCLRLLFVREAIQFSECRWWPSSFPVSFLIAFQGAHNASKDILRHFPELPNPCSIVEMDMVSLCNQRFEHNYKGLHLLADYR